MRRAVATSRRRLRPPLPTGLVGTAASALVSNLVLELTPLLVVHGQAWQLRSTAYPAMFALGFIVLWLLIGLIHALTGRLSVTVGVTACLTLALAYADYNKLSVRREPIYPDDMRFTGQIGFLMHMVGPWTVLVLTGSLVVAAALGFVVVRALSRRFPSSLRDVRDPRTRHRGAVFRVVTGSACLLALAYLTQFNSPGNLARGAYEALGATWRPYSQENNYLSNGFVGGFLNNVDVPSHRAPAGYSRAEMDRIVARYQHEAERINRRRDPGRLAHVNVVLVLSESFSDPEALAGVRVQHDPIPFTRRLMGRTMSGSMFAQDIGGGTANMEFEALTGMSASQLPSQLEVPYNQLVPQYRTFPSAVGWLEKAGHRTVAIHPYTPTMYRRNDVYRSFGIDRFIHDTTMHEQRRSGHHGFISDASAFHEVERTLRLSSKPVFVNLVTMQNHMPYSGRYDDPVHVTTGDGTPLTDIGQYARGLEHTDRALRQFIARLRASHEKTVVVFYGDHLPGGYPQSVFAANGNLAMHRTPFLVWANFPGPRSPQPTTSPAHFMDLALQRADAPVPAYYAMLTELRHAVPAIEDGLLLGPHGGRLRPDHLTPRTSRLLHDYRLVQYDLSVGHRYSQHGMFTTP